MNSTELFQRANRLTDDNDHAGRAPLPITCGETNISLWTGLYSIIDMAAYELRGSENKDFTKVSKVGSIRLLPREVQLRPCCISNWVHHIVFYYPSKPGRREVCDDDDDIVISNVAKIDLLKSQYLTVPIRRQIPTLLHRRIRQTVKQGIGAAGSGDSGVPRARPCIVHCHVSFP